MTDRPPGWEFDLPVDTARRTPPWTEDDPLVKPRLVLMTPWFGGRPPLQRAREGMARSRARGFTCGEGQMVTAMAVGLLAVLALGIVVVVVALT